MNHSPILAPIAVLVAWTMIMWAWTLVTRVAALRKAGVDLSTAAPGGRGQDLEAVLDPKVMWKAHNYNHLMEQPTVFYAIALVLAMTGWGGGLNAQLAWAYVVLRILHSLWQATVNTIPVRFLLFILSSLFLVALTVHALMAVF